MEYLIQVQEKAGMSFKVHCTTSDSHEPTAAPLLSKIVYVPAAPPDWPSSPKPVMHFWPGVFWSLLIDVSLLSFSVAFLASALIVSRYNQASTDEHYLGKERTISASKYVHLKIFNYEICS